MSRDLRAARPGDQGISTIEVVILAPVMILFILVLVAFGQLVDGRGAVDGAARDAARAGSLQRDGGTAMSEAQAAADVDLKGTCLGHPTVTKTSRGFEAGDAFAVEVSCKVRGFGVLGLDITNTVTSKSASPLDRYRRAAP
ncbi:TadE/TadG family type IV pilus assembly protein [Streptomyces sp. SPB162]|uniref:TadE/TadG family type IV pilus assembly protein n=1 Tax=Streptomyces sp. SPB162 TaxID=2940560 RepID=UPI002404FE77|nr:TadE/TadG family type IV pilus assembly protein [Streptomyces sp. SPB162]